MKHQFWKAKIQNVTGKETECLACKHLTRKGLHLIEKNFAWSGGELDLIMKHSEVIVFVEVRFRKNSKFGTGLTSVDKYKQAKIIRTASYYLQIKPLFRDLPCRFDIVSVTKDNTLLNTKAISWVKNAFQIEEKAFYA